MYTQEEIKEVSLELLKHHNFDDPKSGGFDEARLVRAAIKLLDEIKANGSN